MDFAWSKEQEEFREKARAYAEKKLRPAPGAGAPEDGFSRQEWNDCAAFGVQGSFVSRTYGGLGLDFTTGIAIQEGLGAGAADSGLLFSLNAHIWGCCMPILHAGTEEQKRKFLPRLCSGEHIGAHALSEPGAGSDISRVSTRAEARGNTFVLNGTKTFVSNGPVCDIALVYAQVEGSGLTCFIVERNSQGCAVGRAIGKMGLRSSPFGELVFLDCAVPAANMLGKPGEGSMIFNAAMELERAFIFAPQIGVMERQLGACVAYGRTREQFEHPVAEFPAVAGLLADMKVRLETARLLIHQLAWLKDAGRNAFLEASIAKLYVSEAMVQNSLAAIRIHGAYGYTTEFEAEGQLRDSVGTLLCSGTSEIQRSIISRLL